MLPKGSCGSHQGTFRYLSPRDDETRYVQTELSINSLCKQSRSVSLQTESHRTEIVRFSQLIFKNLARRPARTGLTLLALATAITAVVSLLGVAEGFTRSFADVYSSHAVDIVVSRQGSADRLSSSIDAGFVAQIQSLPGVARAAGVMLETLSLEQQAIYGVPTMGLEPGSWLLDSFKFSGPAPAVDDWSLPHADGSAKVKTGLLLGIHLAERIGVQVGQPLMLFDEPYRVIGIFSSTSTWENGSMILPLEELQRLTDRSGQVTYINVVLDSTGAQSAAADNVVQAIQSLDKRLLALTTNEYVQTDTRMQLARAMAWMTSAIAVLIGTIGTWNTMLTSVLERTREIGILRAIGWSRRRVVAMILSESCSMALVASAVGVLCAKFLTWGLSQAPAARGLLSPHIDGKTVVQGLVLAIVIGLMGAILPAWRAAQLSPTEAFREI